MSVPWSNAPIFYALAHIQFNAIPAMAKYEPEISDRLRHVGYPDRQEDKQSVVSFGMTIGGSPDAQKVEHREVQRWRLSNREKTACFLLLPDALIYQTTQYRGREVFFAELRKGLEAVHEIVELDFVERIGLRYLDVVIPREGETLEQYLIPEVLGLGSKLQGLQHGMVEAVAQLPNGTLVSRAFTVNWHEDIPPMPPELLPLQLEIQPRFTQCKGLITVLDNDCFIQTQERAAFSLPAIIATLSQLRDGVSLAFENSITPLAQERWK